MDENLLIYSPVVLRPSDSVWNYVTGSALLSLGLHFSACNCVSQFLIINLFIFVLLPLASVSLESPNTTTAFTFRYSSTISDIFGCHYSSIILSFQEMICVIFITSKLSTIWLSTSWPKAQPCVLAMIQDNSGITPVVPSGMHYIGGMKQNESVQF